MTPGQKSKRFWILLIAGVFGACLLFGLGIWQFQRMAWKDQLMETMIQAVDAPPITQAQMLEDPVQNALKRVHIKGEWGAGINFFVTGKMHKRMSGSHLFNLVQLPSGEYLFVNIGWVSKRDIVMRNTYPADFVGRIRIPDKKSWFMPDHHPQNQEWSYVDLESMGDAVGLEVLPFYVDYVREDTGRAPYPIPPVFPMVNKHLGYALTWISLGLIWIIFCAILIMRQRHDGDTSK